MQLIPVTKIKHPEGFCLMKYVDKKTGKVEWLWNSRDGVTPFGIGPDILHDDWHEDAICPNFVPPVGMRIFVGPPEECPEIIVVSQEAHDKMSHPTRKYVNKLCN